MPNHVLVVLELLEGHSLSNCVKSWKSYSSRRANARPNRCGAFWEADYLDRYMRDEEHLQRTIEYVENNPVKAGLAATPVAWSWSSAARRDGPCIKIGR